MEPLGFGEGSHSSNIFALLLVTLDPRLDFRGDAVINASIGARLFGLLSIRRSRRTSDSRSLQYAFSAVVYNQLLDFTTGILYQSSYVLQSKSLF